MAFILMPHVAFGVFIFGMVVARQFSTYLGLRRVFKTAQVSLQPLDPDRCGGLRHLRDYALKTSYVMGLIGLVFAVLAYTLSREWDDGTITTNPTAMLELPFFWVAAALYVTLTPTVFFGLLWTAHGPMEKVKSETLRQLAHAFDEQHKALMRALKGADSSNLETKIQSLDVVDRLYRKAEAFPVWPLDTRNLTRFGAVFGTPIVISAATILLQKVLVN